MAPSSGTNLHISRTGWISLGIAFLMPWVGVIWLALRNPTAANRPTTQTTPKAAPPVKASGENFLPGGPWGRLEFSRISIEPPEYLVPVEYTAPEALRWVLVGYTPERLSGLWQRAGLTDAQRKYLEEPAHRRIEQGRVVLQLEAEFLLNLTPASRAAIYTALAEFPENGEKQDPYRLREELAVDWFRDSGLSDPILQLTKRMLYQRDGLVMFSDSDVVLPRIPTQEERTRFIKTLSRKSTLLVQLVIQPEENVEPIARYWGTGRRSKDVLPLLQSLARRPGGGRVDIAHLLPAFPRSLLYTYPLPSAKPEDTAHDCHWTSFNFNQAVPDERFLRIETVKQALLEDYFPVPGEPLLGDVLMLVRPNGVVVHSCVYVAANVVFTKNGPSYSVPWVLGDLENVVSFYSVHGPVEVRRFRLKNR